MASIQAPVTVTPIVAAPAPIIKKTPRQAPFWVGGAAATCAAVVTHPLDTMKVRLQTSTTKASLVRMVATIIKQEGLTALYAGLTASLLRQATYSTARFGVYDTLKPMLGTDEKGNSSFLAQLTAGVAGGFVGGIVGSPADLTNVRMQNDGRLPPAERRNYKNAIDGLFRIAKDEGPLGLFRGIGPNVTRGVLMTASQVATYDAIKQGLLATPYFKENIVTHFTASTLAGLIATTVTSPIDVIKTRVMSGKPGLYKSTADAFVKIVKNEGPMALFKGWVPAFARLGPHTIVTFIIYEKIKDLVFKFNPEK
ncbi:hypothetical protein SmJEL517_g00193 [Synchytrium microbalum]|uniref:Uncharacterized protein n=1 Tax=Synchytrium microbalum TaxID=1806994 RepID=A0A507CJI2_9FUNG|nr:uncharacterized protein SmJEL517_g00193 [Synchytrium microbalum]TPX38374.1 hypothetical protein SmJEL517_g00193 [Synchytrium microbalum]